MRIPALAAGAILVLAAACGGSGATNPPGPTATTPPAATATAAGATNAPGPTATTPPTATATATDGCSGSDAIAVQIADSAFSPADVAIAAGCEVTWTNVDSAAHTVTFDNGPDSGQMGNGATFTNAFATPGIFDYHCAIHSSMRGTVVVV